MVGGAGARGRVLDEEQAVSAGDGPQVVVVGALAERVDRHDAHRTLAHRSPDGGGVDGPRVGAHVGEHRRRARVQHGMTSRGVGVVGHDHFVPEGDVETGEGEVQRRGAVADGDRVLDATQRLEAALELAPLRALARDPARLEHGTDCRDFFGAKRRPRECDQLRHSRSVPSN